MDIKVIKKMNENEEDMRTQHVGILNVHVWAWFI